MRQHSGMRIARSILASLIALAASLSILAAPSSVDAPHLHVQLVAPEDQLYPAGPNDVGLYFKLDPGWHVYWSNAGDAGEPPRIRWTLPEGVTAGDMQFPAPKRLPVGPLMDFGYEGEVLFPIKLQVAPSAKDGRITLHGKVDWIVCSDVCIPGKADLEVTLQLVSHQPLVQSGSAADAALFERLASTLPRPLPASDNPVFKATKDGFLLGITTGKRESSAYFFPTDQDILDNPAPQKFTPTATGLILELKKDANLAASPAQLKGVVELSGNRAYTLAAVPGAVAVPSSISWLQLLRSTGLAFLGGLILNLMPCVFPVLFLKGLALVNSGNEERHKLRVHGLVYTAGILVSFWVLVAVLLILRAAGSSLGWGFQFQSPIFLVLMACLLFFLGLSLAGQFEIGLTLTSAGGSLASKEGYTGSFFTGVLAVIVATPCTAPFMGAAIGYALAQPAAVTFAVFTALALGLAAPYVALTLQPAWTRLLPKPGAWMELLRQAVSVPIFITVIWLAWVVAQTYGATLLAALLGSFLLLAIAGWFLGRWPTKRWATAVAVLIAICAAALSVLASIDSERVVPGFQASGPLEFQMNPQEYSNLQHATGSSWEPWSAATVSRYQAQDRPVFVDFTASWCLSCQVNERVALTKPEVQAAFQSANVALLKADWTRHDESITAALTALNRSGVPAYALYIPGQPEPELLPEVLTPGIVTDALSKLPKAATP
jgi:thiol:disulfide interchange protein DsbD